jgi:hypothetical protein
VDLKKTRAAKRGTATTIRAWKVTRAKGVAPFEREFRYRVGVNRPKHPVSYGRLYEGEGINEGVLHVWTSKSDAVSNLDAGEHLIAVSIRRSDLVAVGDRGDLAVRKLRISPRAWAKAFPS